MMRLCLEIEKSARLHTTQHAKLRKEMSWPNLWPIPFIFAGVPLLPPRRPAGQLPVSQGHRLQPEGLRLRLVVQRGLRRVHRVLLAQRGPLLGKEGEINSELQIKAISVLVSS